MAAVRKAESARIAREARTAGDISLSEIVVTGTGTAGNASSATPSDGDGDARRLAGRLFLRHDGVWAEAGAPADLPVVKVKEFGPAYFALLSRLPELEPYWSGLGRVRVGGGRVAVEVADEGVERLAPSELERLVREFRETRS